MISIPCFEANCIMVLLEICLRLEVILKVHIILKFLAYKYISILHYVAKYIHKKPKIQHFTLLLQGEGTPWGSLDTALNESNHYVQNRNNHRYGKKF